MMRHPALLAIAVLFGWPATALAQAAPTHWSAVYAGPIFVTAALLLFGIGRALDAPGWNRLGVVLWILYVA